MNKQKRVEPIPEEFDSYEEAAEFWDAHDTTDYPDVFQTVDVETAFGGRYYEIEIEADVAEVLQAQAQQKGATVSDLASDLLRQRLRPRNHDTQDSAWLAPRPPAPLQTTPPPHPNPGIAPRCQSHASPHRSNQSRTDRGSSSRARLRLADLRRPGNCPAQRPGTRGAGRS